MLHVPFADRLEAGRLLAGELSVRKLTGNAVVLALTRGGVPVGFEVADRLRLPLDIIVARKLGVPWQPELAMGAITDSAEILDDRMIRQLGIPEEEVNEVIVREQVELRRREDLYRGGKPALDLRRRTAILVDDGLATGSTMVVAVRHVRTREPERIIVAVPVGSREGCNRVRKELDSPDDLVCLATPNLFFSVGEWYRDFDQTSDTEVRMLLAESRRQLRNHLSSSTTTSA